MSTEASFKKEQIVPDVVTKAPTKELNVKYTSEKVQLGNEITPGDSSTQPQITWEEDDTRGLFTLIMTDPDAPSRKSPSMREWCHWIVYNIPGNDISKGVTLIDYMGPGPPAGTGLHRYVFLVFKQQEGLSIKPKKLKQRGKWCAQSFIDAHNLIGPIAGNFFQSKNS